MIAARLTRAVGQQSHYREPSITSIDFISKGTAFEKMEGTPELTQIRVADAPKRALQMPLKEK
jgi:hypothetical protein